MKILGLLGKSLKHSFSKKYFNEKFKKLRFNNFVYKNFEIPSIEYFPKLIKSNPNLIGLNVTIPYKTQVIPYLNSLSAEAKAVGAVNTIKIIDNKTLIGYNTDIYGFEESLKNFLDTFNLNALILGTGGAARAVAYVLKKLNINFLFVSRTKKGKNFLLYENLNKQIIENHKLIINTTPLGMFPNNETFPPIPYEAITSEHFLFDLIYNPPETKFLKFGKQQGAKIKNGLEMLILQAEKSWEIFINH